MELFYNCDINNKNIKIFKNQNRIIILFILFSMIIFILFRKNVMVRKISLCFFIFLVLLFISHNIIIII
jgi:hypothetical protein